MIKFVLVAFTGLFFAFSASADPIFGLWQTVGDDNGNYGQIEVKACEDKISVNRTIFLLVLGISIPT